MPNYFKVGQQAARRGETAEDAAARLKLSRSNIAVFLDGFGVRSNPARETLFDRCVRAVESRGGARDPRAVCASAGRKKYGQAEMTRRAIAGKRRAGRARNIGPVLGSLLGGAANTVTTPHQKRFAKFLKSGGKRNPATEAAEAFADFHGHEPNEWVAVTEKRHEHKYLAGAGELRRMSIIPVHRMRGRKNLVTLTRFNGTILAFNEKRNQLYAKGGDQSVDLAQFGIKEPHEIETLGKLKAIDYFGRKDHLGSEGGTATYRHVFRTTNENGRHVTIRIARYPDVIYYVLDERLEFSGGSYQIITEGIDS